MVYHDDGFEDDDALARRLRRAADAFQPPVPERLADRTLATVARDRRRSRGWWRTQAWRPLVAASLLAAITLGLALAPVRQPAAPLSLTWSIPLSPWPALAETPLDTEWRSLRADADRAAQVLVACLPSASAAPSGARR